MWFSPICRMGFEPDLEADYKEGKGVLHDVLLSCVEQDYSL
jgi:hypothetical protein